MSRNRVARYLAMLGVSLACHASAHSAPITRDITCDGMVVGTISVDIMGAGVKGGFSSNAPMFATLAAAAAKCNEHHFNWYQVVTADNMAPKDSGGNQLMPPYVDPPAGGYQNQWADDLPWYWDEGPDPPANTPGFEDGYNVADNTTATTLNFEDFPGGADGTNVKFMTWLVSLNADGSFHSFHEGFSWEYDDPAGAGAPAAKNLAFKPAGTHPDDSMYKDIIGGFKTSLVPEPGQFAALLLGIPVMLIRRKT